MSTKETLPLELIQHECYKAITCLHIAVSELGNTEQRIIAIAQALEANAEIREIASLRTRLDAAEKELAVLKSNSPFDLQKDLMETDLEKAKSELTQLKEANAELVKDLEAYKQAVHMVDITFVAQNVFGLEEGINKEYRQRKSIDTAVTKGTQ
jgi:predicted metal-dependent peptidase